MQEEERLDDCQSNVVCAQSIQSDMGLIEKYQQEIRELDRKINTQQAKLGGSGITMYNTVRIVSDRWDLLVYIVSVA